MSEACKKQGRLFPNRVIITETAFSGRKPCRTGEENEIAPVIWCSTIR